MTNDKRDALKRQCGELLAANHMKPTTKAGRTVVWAFWQGVMASEEKANPYVVLCLMAGRTGELVTLPTK